MTNPAPLFPRVLDYTMWSSWKKCPHLFFRSHCQGLTRPRTNVHLHFGAALASGLEAARRSYFTDADTSDALHNGCEALIAAWGDFEPPAAPTRSEANKTLAACLAAIQAYFREWPLDEDPLRIHVHEGKPCVEWSGALPIPGSLHPDTGEPLLYAGRFDMIGDYQRSVWGEDDKTTSGDPTSESWRNQWKLRGQFTGYCWLAREFGLPLKGFIVRGIGVQKTAIKLGFALVPRPDWMIQQWLAQLQADVAQMCAQWHLWQRTDYLFPHPFSQAFSDACADFGGCSFLDLCSSADPGPWEDIYEIKHWNPLTRSTEE